jgi:mono/diheme cytochrome c family protein
MSEEHAYGLDNIKEQDNRPPTWLVLCWIFLLSWGFWYLVHFWTLPGDEEKQQTLNAPITYKNTAIEGFISSNKDKAEAPKVAVADTSAKDKLMADGKVVFEANCAGCHGIEGGGDGPAAAALTPKPRNFIKAEFKYGSDDASLTHTIQNGVQGTAMPAWKDTLSADQIKAVLVYVHHFKR